MNCEIMESNNLLGGGSPVRQRSMARVGLLYSATIERQFPRENPGSTSFLQPFFDIIEKQSYDVK